MTRQDRYRRIYAALKDAGHTPAKAAEIILDASRGDRHALDWVRAIVHGRHA